MATQMDICPHKNCGNSSCLVYVASKECILSTLMMSGALRYSNLTSVIKGLLLKTSMVDMTVVVTAGYGDGTRSTVVCHPARR